MHLHALQKILVTETQRVTVALFRHIWLGETNEQCVCHTTSMATKRGIVSFSFFLTWQDLFWDLVMLVVSFR